MWQVSFLTSSAGACQAIHVHNREATHLFLGKWMNKDAAIMNTNEIGTVINSCLT